jgi:hypothetical protein
MKNEMKNCFTCGSDDLEYSFGALFGGCSVYCKYCGCKGEMSDTEPKQPDINVRKKQAESNWDAGLFERIKWET